MPDLLSELYGLAKATDRIIRPGTEEPMDQRRRKWNCVAVMMADVLFVVTATAVTTYGPSMLTMPKMASDGRSWMEASGLSSCSQNVQYIVVTIVALTDPTCVSKLPQTCRPVGLSSR